MSRAEFENIGRIVGIGTAVVGMTYEAVKPTSVSASELSSVDPSHTLTVNAVDKVCRVGVQIQDKVFFDMAQVGGDGKLHIIDDRIDPTLGAATGGIAEALSLDGKTSLASTNIVEDSANRVGVGKMEFKTVCNTETVNVEGKPAAGVHFKLVTSQDPENMIDVVVADGDYVTYLFGREYRDARKFLALMDSRTTQIDGLTIDKRKMIEQYLAAQAARTTTPAPVATGTPTSAATLTRTPTPTSTPVGEPGGQGIGFPWIDIAEVAGGIIAGGALFFGITRLIHHLRGTGTSGGGRPSRRGNTLTGCVPFTLEANVEPIRRRVNITADIDCDEGHGRSRRRRTTTTGGTTTP